MYRRSPAAFYVYSTIKIITGAAVTNSDGNSACGTPSRGFPNMNENPQAYFGAPYIKARTHMPAAKNTWENSVSNVNKGFTTKPCAILSSNSDSYQVNARAPLTTAFVISLTMPFIYQPERGRAEPRVSTGACTQRPGTEDYGYVL